MTIGSIMATHKKRVITAAAIALFTLTGTVFGLAFPSSALAWDNCPRGLVNDPYPGACRRYVDTNGDGICDLSQSEPVASTTATTVATTTTLTPTTAAVTKEPTTTTVGTDTATPVAGDPPTSDCPLGPCLGCGACASFNIDSTVEYTDIASAAATGAVLLADGSTDTTSTTTPGSGVSTGSEAATTDAAATTAGDSAGTPFLTHYLVSPIALGFFLIYAVSFVLYKTKRIRISTHRKIWNVLLLATFLVTGIFGVILAIQLDYPLPFNIPIDLLFWHVEAGIVMTLISLFHMGWHFNYYRNILRTSRSKIRAARAAERQALAGERALAAQARDQRRAERETRRTEKERLAWQSKQPAPRLAKAQAAPQSTWRTANPPIVPRSWPEPEVE